MLFRAPEMKASLIKLAYAAVLLLVLGYALFALRAGIPAWMEKRREVRNLEQRNASLAREIEQRREKITRLRESETEQDLEIRQRLKLVKPGEKVFVLQDQDKTAGQP